MYMHTYIHIYIYTYIHIIKAVLGWTWRTTLQEEEERGRDGGRRSAAVGVETAREKETE